MTANPGRPREQPRYKKIPTRTSRQAGLYIPGTRDTHMYIAHTHDRRRYCYHTVIILSLAHGTRGFERLCDMISNTVVCVKSKNTIQL